VGYELNGTFHLFQVSEGGAHPDLYPMRLRDSTGCFDSGNLQEIRYACPQLGNHKWTVNDILRRGPSQVLCKLDVRYREITEG